MCIPVSPVIANIYLEHFESSAIPTYSTLVKWWFRYVDDVHNSTRRDQVNKVQEHLNSIHPYITFTTELPGTSWLPFLDALIKPTPSSIKSTVNRKSTYKDGYLDCNSNCPISTKLSIIHALIHRGKQVCSTPQFLANKMNYLIRFLILLSLEALK